jgi:hypothetical protein
MKLSSALLITTTCLVFIFSSCKKGELVDVTEKPTITVPVTDTVATEVVVPVTGYKRTIEVGTGSGALVIDGKTLITQCNDLIKIKGGTYTNISVKDIISADGCPITIKNDGLVKITGNYNSMGLTNLKNVIISGDGTSGIAQGFAFSDNSYRAVQILGTLDKFTMQYMSFKNIGDQDITYNNTTVYDGSEASYSKDLHFLNMVCDNTASFLSVGGYVENGVVYGLVKNIEVANLDFQNAPGVGTVVYMGNAEGYNIHHNKINNINTTNNNHNGIFSISGNGSFHNNYVSNHQGNAIRAWGHTVGSTPKNIYIYNNIVVNSRKYSGFEVQAYASRIMAGKTTYTNAIVFNNTCGNLNLSKDWQAGVLDVYSLQGGKVDAFNNLGYNFTADSHIIAQWAELIPNSFSNLYYASYGAAKLVDEKNFRLASSAPEKNAGKPTPFVITDYYGNVRSASAPTIGAVE